MVHQSSNAIARIIAPLTTRTGVRFRGSQTRSRPSMCFGERLIMPSNVCLPLPTQTSIPRFCNDLLDNRKIDRYQFTRQYRSVKQRWGDEVPREQVCSLTKMSKE